MQGHADELTDDLVRLRDWAESAPLSEVVSAEVILGNIARQRRARAAADELRRAAAGAPPLRLVPADREARDDDRERAGLRVLADEPRQAWDEEFRVYGGEG